MKALFKYDQREPYAMEITENGDQLKITHPKIFGISAIPLQELPLRFILDEENSAFILPDNSEVTIDRDTRHGKKGFRGCRYINGTWDEKYLFFPHEKALIEAMATGDLSEARKAF